jgi:hypothetical protein
MLFLTADRIYVCLSIILESNSELIFFIPVLDYAMKITYVFFYLCEQARFVML